MKKGKLAGLGMMLVISISTALAQYSVDNRTDIDDDLLAYCNRETAYSTGVSDARKGLSRKEDYARICSTNKETFNSVYNAGYNYGLTNQRGLVVNEPSPYHPEIEDQLPSSYVQPYNRPRIIVTPNITPNITGGITKTYSQSSPASVYPGERGVATGNLAKSAPEHGLHSLIQIMPSSQLKCIETASGEACGYNCVNSLNNVRCATSPDQVCRGNELGRIACGYNCVATSKTVQCALHPTDLCIADNNGNVYCGLNCRVERNAIGVCEIERYMPN